MPVELSSELLQRVAISVLEEAAFIFAEPVDQPPQWDCEIMSAGISFAGPFQGWLVLTAGHDFARDLAANMLGLEPDDPEARSYADSALGELLNMIGGVILAELFGTREVCQLDLPTVHAVAPAAAPGEATHAASLLTEEGHRLDIAVVVTAVRGLGKGAAA